jgi:hypothetical protein
VAQETRDNKNYNVHTCAKKNHMGWASPLDSQQLMPLQAQGRLGRVGRPNANQVPLTAWVFFTLWLPSSKALSLVMMCSTPVLFILSLLFILGLPFETHHFSGSLPWWTGRAHPSFQSSGIVK